MNTITQRKAAFKAGSALQALSLLGAGIFAATAFAAPAMAQDTQDASVGPIESQDASTTDASGSASTGQGIVVTGSRMRSRISSRPARSRWSRRRMLRPARPGLKISSTRCRRSSPARVGTIANGATGIATLNLRGLGSERTLVLVNGRRLVPGDPTTSAADINIIPAALMKRVDVLTGGASSVYGADAVAGVVNFVMDTDFEGFRIDAQYGVYNHNNRAAAPITERARCARLPLSDAVSRPMAARSTSRSPSAPASMMAAATSPPMPAIARSIRSLQASRDYSSCALSGSSTAQSVHLRQFVHLRWLGDFAHGSCSAIRRTQGDGPNGDQPDGIANSLTSTIFSSAQRPLAGHGFTRVQLRADELPPASG